MKLIKGIIPIAAAPFTRTGLVDEDSFQSMVRHLLNTGIQGITLFGLVTEFYKLTDDEKNRLLKLLLAETTKHADVLSMISITDHALETAVQRAKQAQDMGADSLMLLPPFFLQPSEEAIVAHIEAIAQAVSIPIIVQYAPNQTGVRIQPQTFVELNNRYDTIQFIKVETQPPGKYVSKLYEDSQGALKSLVGYAGIQMPDVMDRSAVGIQPGCSFVEIYVKLYRLYVSDDRAEYEQLFGKLLPYISYWMQGVELIIRAEKVILQKRGIIASDYCRSPYYSFDTAEMSKVEQFMQLFHEIIPPISKSMEATANENN